MLLTFKPKPKAKTKVDNKPDNYISFLNARKNFDSTNYLVWSSDNELNHNLPNNKAHEIIQLSEIRKIEREPQKIRIELKTCEVKYFGFTYFFSRYELRFLIFLTG